MYFSIIGHDFKYELEKVARLFLPFMKFGFISEMPPSDCDAVLTVLAKDGGLLKAEVSLSAGGKRTERSETLPAAATERETELCLARLLYELFADVTGYRPPWGILTGIRPARLLSRMRAEYGTAEADRLFSSQMLVSERKAALCSACLSREEKIIDASLPRAFSLYISVPFCPSRCKYCSFVSHSVESAEKLIPQYVELLIRELEYTASAAKELGLTLQTAYIGGGTPTTLSAEQLSAVMDTVTSRFDTSHLAEFTVEAGRPDTVTREKLRAIKRCGATRISINPQTMNDEVLRLVGRKHTAAMTVDAFNLARAEGHNNINTDLIAGLDGDTPESFNDTLTKVLELDPENVTVHTLSVKRASGLSKQGKVFDLSAGETVGKMTDSAYDRLTAAGILPYYMYRQGKTVGNLENVGYAKPGYEGLYNVYIMDETHTILACGASAVTKLRRPNGDSIERIFNYKYPYEYISRFNVAIERKSQISEFYKKFDAESD